MKILDSLNQSSDFASHDSMRIEKLHECVSDDIRYPVMINIPRRVKLPYNAVQEFGLLNRAKFRRCRQYGRPVKAVALISLLR